MKSIIFSSSIMVAEPKSTCERFFAFVWKKYFIHTADYDALTLAMETEAEKIGAKFSRKYVDNKFDHKFILNFEDDDDYLLFMLKF